MSDKTTVFQTPVSGLEFPLSKPEQRMAIIVHDATGTQPPTIIDQMGARDS